MAQRSFKDADAVNPFIGRRGYGLRRHRTVLYNDAEWEMVEELARLHGKAPRVFIREASLGTLTAMRPNREHAPLIRELGRCGAALGRLAGVARASGDLTQATTLEGALAEVLALVRQVATEHSRAQRR